MAELRSMVLRFRETQLEKVWDSTSQQEKSHIERILKNLHLYGKVKCRTCSSNVQRVLQLLGCYLCGRSLGADIFVCRNGDNTAAVEFSRNPNKIRLGHCVRFTNI